jgi:hypothetical protein
MRRRTLTLLLLLTLLAGGCVWLGSLVGKPKFAIPISGALLLCAYGLFMRWVHLRAATGGGPVVRFLEQVRRAIAFESPDPAPRSDPSSEATH